MKPRIVSLAPRSHLDWMMRADVQAALREEFDLWQSPEPRHLSPEEAGKELRGAVGVLTGWGAREFSPQVLEGAQGRISIESVRGARFGYWLDEIERELPPEAARFGE